MNLSRKLFLTLRLLVAAFILIPTAAMAFEIGPAAVHEVHHGASQGQRDCCDEPSMKSCAVICLVSCVIAIPSRLASDVLPLERTTYYASTTSLPRGTGPVADTPPPKRPI